MLRSRLFGQLVGGPLPPSPPDGVPAPPDPAHLALRSRVAGVEATKSFAEADAQTPPIGRLKGDFWQQGGRIEAPVTGAIGRDPFIQRTGMWATTWRSVP